MKVLMIANAAATHTKRWASAMANEGHDVRLLSVRHRNIEGVDVVSFASHHGTDPSRAGLTAGYARLRLGLPKELASFGPDIVHAHYASTNGYIAALAHARPTLLTVWGTDIIPKPSGSLSASHRHRARKAVEHASLITSASPYMADRVRDLVPETSVEIVSFGVDQDLFSPSPTPTGFEVLIAKSLEQRYGIDVVVEAMDEVVRAVPEASLTIAGAGSQRAFLEKKAANCAAPVEFMGAVPHGDLPALMSRSAVVVNPTVVDESFGVVILEAQAVGRPVVSPRVGAVPDVCIEGRTALLVPPHDPHAMATAIVDSLQDGLPDAANEGPRFVSERFTWKASVDMMNALYSVVADA
jgi:glycosyltransferase involved in cell wall biosynthesis